MYVYSSAVARQWTAAFCIARWALPGETGAGFICVPILSPPVRRPSCNRASGIPPPIQKERSLMLKGKCPKCGAEYVGWALSNPQERKCSKCGGRLVVIAEGKPKVVNDYPPPPEQRLDFDSRACVFVK